MKFSASLQSMACAHRRYFCAKPVAHQVFLGVATNMGVTGCGPIEMSANKNKYSTVVYEQFEIP